MIDTSKIPYGKISRTLEDNFFPTKDSSWLEMPNTVGGSLGFNGIYYYEIGNNTPGGAISMRTTVVVPSDNLKYIGVFVDGFHFTHQGMAPGISITSATKTSGVSIWSPSGSSTSVCRFFGSGRPDVSVPYSWGANEYNRKRNIGLVMLPPTKEIFLMMDDQVIWSIQESEMVLGGVRGMIDSSQPAGINSGKIRLAKFKFTIQHN